MAENAGSIYYEVDAKTEGVIEAGRKAVQSLDQLQTAFDRTDRASAKSATAMGKAAKATDDEAAALRNLLGQIDPVIGKTQQLDRWTEQLGRHFDAGRISGNDYAAALAKLDKQYDELNKDTAQASKTTQGFAGRLTPLAGLIAGVITAQSLANVGRLAEEFTLLQSRINRLSPDLESAAGTYQRLLSIASATGQTVPNTVKLWETLTSSLKELGATNAEVLTLTDSLQKIGKIGGSSSEETANALRQLGQALASGRLQAEEYNSIVDQTPELVRQLAAAAGMSMGDFRQAMLDGKISAQDLFDLLLSRTTQVDTEFKKLPRSAADAGNAVVVAFGAALSQLDKTLGVSQRLAQALDGVAKNIRNLSGQQNLAEVNTELAAAEAALARIEKRGIFGFGKKEMEDQIKQLRERKALLEQSAAAPASAPQRAAPTTTKEGQEAIKALSEQNALLRVQGEERVRLATLQKLGSQATQQERDQAVALAVDSYRLAEAEKARQDAKRKGAAASKKEDAEAAAAIKKENEDSRRAYEQNQQVIQRMAEALAYASLQGEALAVAQAKAQLNKFASPEDVAEVERLTRALVAQQEAKANQQLLGQVDPIVGAQQGYEAELAKYQQLNDAKLLSDQRYLELKGQLDAEHAATMQQLEEQRFAQQSKGNALLIGTLNQVQAAGTQAFTGLLTGATNGQEAVQQLGQALLNEVVGSLVQVGVQYLKNLAIQSSAGSAAAAVSAAQGAATAAAWAPAAAAASIGTLGGAAGVGLSAVAAVLPAITGLFGGGRKAGGPVNAGTMYRVNEGGAPEVFNAGGQQYMIPNMRGEVVSNRDATNGAAGSGGAGTTVNIHNNNGSNVRTSSKQMDRQEIIDVFIDDYMNGGQTSKAISTGTGTKRRGT